MNPRVPQPGLDSEFYLIEKTLAARGLERQPEETLAAFRNEHPNLRGDPLAALARGQLFFTYEPDDPAPRYVRAALGAAGERVCGLAIDYGHWDATLKDCVALATSAADGDAAFAARLLGANTLAFYGARLAERVQVVASEGVVHAA